jgi:hypothetical protein
VIADLGVFTPAELRAGGINSRGFLQPILPAPEGVDVWVESETAADGLASRGLLVRRGSGWRPVGRYRQVLETAAVARSLLAIETVGRGSGAGVPRLAFGAIGVTDEVLLLDPQAGGRAGYGARLLPLATAAVELAGALGFHARVGVAADEPPATSESEPGWARIDDLLTGGVATVRVEAASISQRQGPLLQRRLTVVATGAGDWLLLGTRYGDQAGRAAAPAGLAMAARVMRHLLGGLPLEL